MREPHLEETSEGKKLQRPYTPSVHETGAAAVQEVPFFAADLCVTEGDVNTIGISTAEHTCAGLFALTKHSLLSPEY